jgi:hypothetical protein
MGEQDDEPGAVPEPRRRRWLPIGLGLGAAAVAAAVGISVAVAPSASPSPQPVATTTSTATATSTPRTTAAAPATPTVPADVAARERAELVETAALLVSPLSLTSPAGWDQWLPGGKPYPGPSLEEEISTCPRLSDRLGAALGQKMSYWTGTLPNGPMGCTWATVPLSYGPNAPNYPYVLSVGYLADGTTTKDWRHHYYEHRGALCPDVDVPAVGPDAVLVRCDNDNTSYALMFPDRRRDGVWFLQADARSDAAHPASDALTALVDGVSAAYG